MNRSTLSVDDRIVELLELIASELCAVHALLEERWVPQRDQLLGEAEVARVLGIDVRTLREIRREHAAPRCVMVGRSPKWRRSAVDAWLAKREAA